MPKGDGEGDGVGATPTFEIVDRSWRTPAPSAIAMATTAATLSNPFMVWLLVGSMSRWGPARR